MYIFTDRVLLNAYLEDRKNAFDGNSQHPRVSPSPPEHYPRQTYFDAAFYFPASENSQDVYEENGKYSRGIDAWYVFSPDLVRPQINQTVVMRGSTWIEGKYNIEEREVSWLNNKISLMSYDIYNVIPKGRYYTFSIKRIVDKDERTRKIFNILLNESFLVKSEYIKVLDDNIAYVYLGWMYSVTVDGGRTWNLWNAERDLPEWTCCNPGLIKEINLSIQGDGTMTLQPDPNNSGLNILLRTVDFGKHWKKE